MPSVSSDQEGATTLPVIWLWGLWYETMQDQQYCTSHFAGECDISNSNMYNYSLLLAGLKSESMSAAVTERETYKS